MQKTAACVEKLRIGLLILEWLGFRNTYRNVKGANGCQMSTLLMSDACWPRS